MIFVLFFGLLMMKLVRICFVNVDYSMFKSSGSLQIEMPLSKYKCCCCWIVGNDTMFVW